VLLVQSTFSSKIITFNNIRRQISVYQDWYLKVPRRFETTLIHLLRNEKHYVYEIKSVPVQEMQLESCFPTQGKAPLYFHPPEVHHYMHLEHHQLIIQYGKLLNKPEYIERGYAALKASFVMMYCPENPQTMKQWEKVYPFFGREDYGFMMENYGHGGRTGPDGEGMGEFTIYDWGNGAAAEAYNRILDKFGNFNLE
jgi:hypothetical protein